MHHFGRFSDIDGSARWQANFNFIHTPHAGTLPSTGHGPVPVLLARGQNIMFIVKK